MIKHGTFTRMYTLSEAESGIVFLEHELKYIDETKSILLILKYAQLY